MPTTPPKPAPIKKKASHSFQELSELDLAGLGHFDKNEPATFLINKLNLPTSWDYIYQNKKLLLKVDQFGPIYAQVNPPTDILLLRRESFQNHSSWLVWLRSKDFKTKAFTNFFRPRMSISNPSQEPDRCEIRFSPTSAIYTIEFEGVRCRTEFLLPENQHAIAMKVTVTNLRKQFLNLSATPVLRTYMNPASLAPWDKPEWYLKTALCSDKNIGFTTQLLNMDCHPEKRRAAVLWTSKEKLSGAEISYEKFIGAGTFDAPQSIAEGKLRLSPSQGKKWGIFETENLFFGYPPVNAFQYDLNLKPKESFTFHQVLALLPNGPKGSFPSMTSGKQVSTFLKKDVFQSERKKINRRLEKIIKSRRIETQDPAFNRYVNEWLPLQMDWVCSLDRGWPSGMRGSRDSAQDFTPMVGVDPRWTRQIIELLFSCQRSDGWFPRQYSALGRTGKHDLRGHVDAGNCVIELVYHYLCFTKDFDLLKQKQPWLDQNREDSIFNHLLQAMEFYLHPKNLGIHGLCKIGEGDWLDGANRAGIEGRGESVTVSNQTVISCILLTEILSTIQDDGFLSKKKTTELITRLNKKQKTMRANIRKHAFNKEGYFNSIFNDDGHWIFSNKDPDGERRVYGPSNWYSIASGVAGADLTDSVLKEMKFLKCDSGYRLYWPPMGQIPIKKLGRVGSGDCPAGLGENGTPYNHGSHGFLGRALAVAGRGNDLYEVIRSLFPYDQTIHPVQSSMSPPYAVVNCWQNIPSFKNRGLMTFLTGSIGMGWRMVYEWMFGIQPKPNGLVIDPCLPQSFTQVTAEFKYLNKKIKLNILNPQGTQTGVKSMTVNGKPITTTQKDPFSGRMLHLAKDSCFNKAINKIEVII